MGPREPIRGLGLPFTRCAGAGQCWGVLRAASRALCGPSPVWVWRGLVGLMCSLFLSVGERFMGLSLSRPVLAVARAAFSFVCPLSCGRPCTKCFALQG